MKVVNWIVENWFLLVALAAGAGVGIVAIYYFAGFPTEKQKKKITEWLVWACIVAERELQSGTGQLKLREVWNMFCAVPAFAVVAKLISFERFSGWVKDALIIAKKMLVENSNLASYVYGDQAEDEIEKIGQQLFAQNE